MKTSQNQMDSDQSAQQKSEPFFQPESKRSSNFFGVSNTFFPIIQPKLSIGKAGDQYEQEADSMAEFVVNRSARPADAPQVQSQCTDCEEEAQMKPEIQRIEEEEMELQREELEEERESVQKKGNGGLTSASPEFERQLASPSSGQSLPANTLAEMNDAYGADFSNVKVHNDSKAVQMSQDIGAQAFTHGNNVYFNQGKYNPEHSEGKKLLAHELTHTIQQGAVEQDE